nr:UDPGP type 1 family protein [candidate division KSB1 bacterium]NIR70940.1 UDPGP type 1 family protein [candidate division KSB1 bacterium]NIS23244.1 UDPGP type 1 family protein [candidate division KSB1 bacterium]NIT70126.1 UDPGP type 1 family protein [candidate division KSB1 bacterium]NIU27860.1 UDPGP type 1 family protein [candidate division KSB1 bacterium]
MTVATENPEDRELIQRVYDFGQGHVFRFWDELNDASRQKLLNQLKTIDFQLLAELYEDLIKSSPAESFEEQLEPAEFTRLPQTQEEMAAFEKAKQVGEEALRRGRVAAFQVAGGQGSRLGFDGPKGMFPITPIKNKSLFQHYAEYLQALGKRYDVIVPWYIMTSETNHQPTVDFFESQNYFNLNPGDVFFF